MTRSSRLTGFYARPLAERRAEVAARLPTSLVAWLESDGGLPMETADAMTENVVATMGLPFAVATNFVIDGREVLVPMATEEPSVVAAASNAARLTRAAGGFVTSIDDSLMAAQIHIDGADDDAVAKLLARTAEWLALGDAAVPSLVGRGGGCRELSVRLVDAATGAVVVDIWLDVKDAMGANLADTVAEAVAPRMIECVGGRALMRILSNLCTRRLARASCRIPLDEIGRTIAHRIVRATWFAEHDAGRAATHNKGIMNGVDAVAMATGQDVRALEAGAHAFACQSGRYSPLSHWRVDGAYLVGELTLPAAVGIVGAATTMPSSRAGLALLRCERAQDLAAAIVCAGLASNLAALRALVSEGIQQGHMRLHERRGSLA